MTAGQDSQIPTGSRTDGASLNDPQRDMTVSVMLADYHDPVHAKALVDLLDAYASDPAGGGK